MDKKRITGLILGFFLFLVAGSFRPAFAMCQTIKPNGVCPVTNVMNPYNCSDGKTCCSTQSECSTTAASKTGNGTNTQTGNQAIATSVCDYIKNGAERTSCSDCMGADNGGTWTAFGCISSDPAQMISKFLGIGIGMAGGIAFLLILFGGFQILTSAGNPEQLNAGRELISSAIAGLLLIIFSIFLLRIIGVNILQIPGFK